MQSSESELKHRQLAERHAIEMTESEEKYQRLHRELAGLHKSLFAVKGEKDKYSAEQTTLQRQLSSLETEKQRLQQQIKRLSTDMDALKTEMMAKDDHLIDIQKKADNFEVEKATWNHSMNDLRFQLQNLQKSLHEKESELEKSKLHTDTIVKEWEGI